MLAFVRQILLRMEEFKQIAASNTQVPGRLYSEDSPPSLFIVALPRSLSSITYALAGKALDLREPEFTTYGEILNFDRHIDYSEVGEDVWRRFTRKGLEPGIFYQNIIFLNHIVRPKGYIYKDVVQPFVVSEWLAGQKFRILYIRRNLAEVALSMLRQGWWYPGQASSRSDEPEFGMLEGLVRAEEALSRLPALQVEYDDLVADEEALWTVLKRLYPERKLMRIPFINKEFQAKRAKTLAMRETPELANLARKIEQVRQRLAQGASAA